MRLVLAPGLLFVMVGCAHGVGGVTNEARLEESTAAEAESTDANALRCRDTSPEVQLARDVTASKADRIDRYDSAVKQAKATEGQFDEEFRRDPDLIYGPQAGEWQHRRQLCVDLVATFERERQALQGDAAPVAPVAAAVEAAKAPAPVVEAAKPTRAAKAKKDKLAKGKGRGKKLRLARAD